MTPARPAERYRQNILAERESAALYDLLAGAEKDPRLAEIYSKMAGVERRHAEVWARHLRESGEAVPAYAPTLRLRLLGMLARRFGAGAVLPVVTAMERQAVHAYDGQPEAAAAGMPREERSHARVFRYLDTATRGGMSGAVMAQLEGRHRATGGNALRAAVLGASDGLTSNLSLVMGVAGAALAGRGILVTGLAGMLAGALSMAIGEWLSVQSARELFERQIGVERQELEEVPDEEREELALIYQAKGIDAQRAREMAESILAQDGSALDTLAREELGIDPNELGGSAIVAAATSFCLFAAGAVIPVLPFAFLNGLVAVAISLVLSMLGLFVIGLGITLTTGTPLLKAGGRQVILGLAAALVTFVLGKLVGGALG
jgi:VIT1/CCC1 family predicted Fe2+/Mn2+ transporter